MLIFGALAMSLLAILLTVFLKMEELVVPSFVMFFLTIIIGVIWEYIYRKEVVRRFVLNGMDPKKAEFLYSWNKSLEGFDGGSE